jgi:hypothetical protein
VGQPIYQATAAARAARIRFLALAEHQLGEPEREALLADAGGPGYDEHLWQPPRSDRLGEAAPGLDVSGDGRKRHGSEAKKRGAKG